MQRFDPWKSLGIQTNIQRAQLDKVAIDVLIGIRNGLTCEQISIQCDYSASLVEMFQHLFCARCWCDYNVTTSQCVPSKLIDFDRLIENWKEYYVRRWGLIESGDSHDDNLTLHDDTGVYSASPGVGANSISSEFRDYDYAGLPESSG